MLFYRDFFLILCFILVIGSCICSCASNGTETFNKDAEQENAAYPLKEYFAEKQADSPKATDLSPIFADLSPLNQKVTLTFREQAPLAALREIGKMLGVTVILDPDLSQYLSGRTLNLHLENMTMRDALDRITSVLDISWKEEAGGIYVTPYMKEVIDLPLLDVGSTKNFELGGDVIGEASISTGGTSGGGGGGSSSSGGGSSPLKGKFEITGESEEKDLFDVICSSLQGILQFECTLDPNCSISAQGQGSSSTTEQGAGSCFYATSSSYINLSEQAGLLWVYGRPRVVKKVKEWVNSLLSQFKRQVLIDATILEVRLSHRFKWGIDWSAIQKNLFNTGDVINFSLIGQQISDRPIFRLQYTSKYFNAILNSIKRFGDVNVISHPKILVSHRQTALMSVGKSITYLSLEPQSTTTTTQTATTTGSQPQPTIASVFEGILLGITAHIDNKDHVTLHLVPFKTDVDPDSLNERQKEIAGQKFPVTLPVLNLQETSTIIRARNNDLVVIGGLIQEVSSSDKTNHPPFDSVPAIGGLFKNESKMTQKNELVIILRLTVI